MPGTRCVLTAVFIVVFAGDGARAAQLYGVDFSSSELYTIDVGTGTATLVGSTGLTGLSGLAFDDSGALYTIDNDLSDQEFHELDPADGSATLVGTTGVGGGEGALVYDPGAGLFYSKAGSSGVALELTSIDPGTGVATVVGNMGLNPEADVTGLGLLSDGTLLAYDVQSALPSRILTINKLTGAATIVGTTGAPFISSIGGLAVDPDTGTAYMSDAVDLYTVDPLTGAATLVGPLGTTISGLSFGPAPKVPGLGPWAMAALVAAVLGTAWAQRSPGAAAA